MERASERLSEREKGGSEREGGRGVVPLFAIV